MELTSLIYIASTGDAVFDSQVVYFLKGLLERKFFKRIILLAGVKIDQSWEKELSKLIKSDLEIVLFKQYPNYSFYGKKQKNEIHSILKRILTNNTIIHLRGEFLTGIIRKIIDLEDYENVKILTDIRGIALEEMKIYSYVNFNPIKYHLKLHHYSKCMKNVGTKSDYISCVSETLRKEVLTKTTINNELIGVNHCIANTDFTYSHEKRLLFRRILGLDIEEVLFVFVTSGNGLYENTNEILRIIIEKGYKVLNLSKTIIEDKNIINLFVPFPDVTNYLSAADIGMVWRNNDIVNNVASPVKFSEYVCCGLPVMANNGVHLINQYIKNTGFGKTIEKIEEINNMNINHLLKIDRNKISQLAKGIFSSEVITQNYLKIYKKLLNSDLDN